MPKNRGTMRIAYSNDKIATVAFSMQIVGLNYNDDLNVNFIPRPDADARPATRVVSGGSAGLHRRRT